LWRYFTGDNTTEEYPGIYSLYISVGVYIMYRWCDNIGRVLPGTGVRNEENEDVTI